MQIRCCMEWTMQLPFVTKWRKSEFFLQKHLHYRKNLYFCIVKSRQSLSNQTAGYCFLSPSSYSIPIFHISLYLRLVSVCPSKKLCDGRSPTLRLRYKTGFSAGFGWQFPGSRLFWVDNFDSLLARSSQGAVKDLARCTHTLPIV